MVEFCQFGTFDIYFKKYDEHVACEKTRAMAKNVILGGVYFDAEDTIKIKSLKTGAYVTMTYVPRQGDRQSYIEGTGFDANDRPVYKISGSWLSDLTLKNLLTGHTETVWEEPELVNDAHL